MVGVCRSNCFALATSHGGTTSTIGADLALGLLRVSKALFHPAPDYVVFLGDSDTKMQGAEVFGLLAPAAGNVMIFALLHRVGVLPWHW